MGNGRALVGGVGGNIGMTASSTALVVGQSIYHGMTAEETGVESSKSRAGLCRLVYLM